MIKFPQKKSEEEHIMGAHKKYEVSLTGVQKGHLEKYIRTGNGKSARKIAGAGILLHCADGRTYEHTAESVKVCQTAVCSTVKRFAENGLDFAPEGRPFPGKPPKPDGKTRAAMTGAACSDPPEDRNPDEPKICFGEKPCQLTDHAAAPLPPEPGMPQRTDYHYKRCGVCSILCAAEPETGKRPVRITEHRTRQDYARFMKELSGLYPGVKKSGWCRIISAPIPEVLFMKPLMRKPLTVLSADLSIISHPKRQAGPIWLKLNFQHCQSSVLPILLWPRRTVAIARRVMALSAY